LEADDREVSPEFQRRGQVLDSSIPKSEKKNVRHIRGFKFTVVRVRFNDFKIVVKRQFTLVLNIK
jgi:hypothetical protein